MNFNTLFLSRDIQYTYVIIIFLFYCEIHFLAIDCLDITLKQDFNEFMQIENQFYRSKFFR